ncbi:MAG: DUF2807 domain-containing protein [Chitinophagaceae bacterium]|nr:MAG: DUF2807 domain-containing protein [Chitinophagaceae bacterium]
MKRFLPALFITLSITAGANAATILPKGATATHRLNDERIVKDFTGVVAGGPIDVVVKIGMKEGVRFEGDADAIATLVTEVKGKVLIIRPKTSWTSWAKKYENKKITAYVTAKDITSLAMSGNGSITAASELISREFTATLSGSGSITAKVNTDALTAVISGSGNLMLSGKADESKVTLSGSGKLSGKDLSMDILSARISGSGSITAHVEDLIKASISGSGHVYYTGYASLEQKVFGSGGITKL